MSHISGSPTGSTETISEAIGVHGLHRTASSTEYPWPCGPPKVMKIGVVGTLVVQGMEEVVTALEQYSP